MFDLNAVLSAALQQAVAEATKPLLDRIEKLETTCNAYEILHKAAAENAEVMRDRVIALEIQRTVEDAAVLRERIEALEQATPEAAVPINEARLVEVLDQQEWFWEKLTRKAGEAAEAAAEAALNDHCDTYNHDDYDSTAAALDNYDLDDFVVRGDLEEAINSALDSATISIRV